MIFDYLSEPAKVWQIVLYVFIYDVVVDLLEK